MFKKKEEKKTKQNNNNNKKSCIWHNKNVSYKEKKIFLQMYNLGVLFFFFFLIIKIIR